MSINLNIEELDFSKPKISEIFNNPLHPENHHLLPQEFLDLYNNLETYYAPIKIVTFEDMSRLEVKKHLMTIFGDADFCDTYAGVIKKDYKGTYGKAVMTPKQARNYLKKCSKKQ